MSLTNRWRKKKAKLEARAEADRIVEDANDFLCQKMDALWLYTMHITFGFGKKRLLRLYWAMIDNFEKVIKRYNRMCDNDDVEWFVINKRLKEIGIDVKELQEEAVRRYPNGVKVAVKEGESGDNT